MGLNYFGIKFDVTDFADMDISYQLPLHTVQYWSCSFVHHLNWMVINILFKLFRYNIGSFKS